MKNQIRNLLILLSIVIGAILLYVLGIVLINIVNEYAPENRALNIESPVVILPGSDSLSFSVISWNIGYGGLGKDMDFFYDGGESVRPDEDQYHNYFAGILKDIDAMDSVDFLLFQEVDSCSKRSYYENQFEEVSEVLDHHSALYVKNYDVEFVPMPVLEPMGKVISGLASFSSYGYTSAEQIVLPGTYSWPTSLFMLDRCFLTSTLALENGKTLYVINTHLSAFDDGNQREEQLKAMQKYMQALFENGNYIVAVGDWNINPPTYTNTSFNSGDVSFRESPSMDFDWFGPDWQIVFDSDFPTNRKVDKLYTKGVSPTTILDYFICSPNIKVLNNKTLYTSFQNTDHHSLYLQFSLK